MRVERDRFYRTRSGIVVGPMVRSSIQDVTFPWYGKGIGEYIVSWPDDGRYMWIFGEQEWDLMEEVIK